MDRTVGNLAYLPFTGNPAHGGRLPTPNNLQNHAFNFPSTFPTYPACHLGPGPAFMGYQPQNEMNANVMPMPPLPPRPIESEQEHQNRLFLEQFRYAGQQQEYESPRFDPTIHDTIRRMESLKVASEASANDNASSPTSQLRGDAPEFVPGKKDDQVEEKSRNSGSQFSWTIVSSSNSGYQ
ncbi:hypothetical protein AWENTII_010513 [Aspergillus wentii]|nr:hypothetical protein MW887_009687 [Aspergillus wentii]